MGLLLAVLANEFYPEIEAYFHPGFIIPSIAIIGGALGLIKGYNHYSNFLFPLFSTAGTILVPVIALTIIFYLLGYDRGLTLPPVLFKTGIGLKEIDTQLSTYILSIFFTLTAVAAFISSLTINKKKRWTW